MRIKAPFFIGMLVIILAGIPATFYLALNRQNSKSSAHTASPTASAVCNDGGITITFSDTVQRLSGGSATVTLSDTLGLFDGTQKTLTEGQSFSITKSTNKNVLQAGDELIHTAAIFSNYPTQTNDIPVNAIGPCITPSPTPTFTPPTPTPSNSPSPTSTPTPSPCSVPSPVTNVKILCPNCNNQ